MAKVLFGPEGAECWRYRNGAWVGAHRNYFDGRLSAADQRRLLELLASL